MPQKKPLRSAGLTAAQVLEFYPSKPTKKPRKNHRWEKVQVGPWSPTGHDEPAPHQWVEVEATLDSGIPVRGVLAEAMMAVRTAHPRAISDERALAILARFYLSRR